MKCKEIGKKKNSIILRLLVKNHIYSSIFTTEEFFKIQTTHLTSIMSSYVFCLKYKRRGIDLSRFRTFHYVI